MCDSCGCGNPDNTVTIRKPGEPGLQEHSHDEGYPPGSGHSHNHEHPHSHEFTHGHGHSHEHTHTHEPALEDHATRRRIRIEEDILGRNNLIASRNAGYLEAKGVVAVNLMSSPGSGKTTLLEKSIIALKGKREISVIEGDQQTLRDAERIHETGTQVIQVNTGNGCHLDASMVRQALEQLDLKGDSLLFIENVGNLVCPSLFELGENVRVVIVSVTEGEDKSLKYPTMFENADVCVINKTDLLPYVEYDLKKARSHILSVNPDMKIIELSATTGEGLHTWVEWILSLKSAG